MVRIYRARIAAICLTVLALLSGGCGGASFEQISRILADPSSFSARDVSVKGRVTRVIDPTAGLLNIAAYQVDDGSGRIWVISRSGVPSEGQEVGLKARVRRDFRLGNELFGAVLNEVERNRR